MSRATDDPVYAKFYAQRGAATARGIGWELSFAQWLEIWERSGHWQLRGRKYVMARHGDKGPYATGNVEIITASQNSKDGFKNRFGETKHADGRPVGRYNEAVNKIVRKCESLGLSRTEIAKMAGLSLSAVSLLADGRRGANAQFATITALRTTLTHAERKARTEAAP